MAISQKSSAKASSIRSRFRVLGCSPVFDFELLFSVLLMLNLFVFCANFPWASGFLSFFFSGPSVLKLLFSHQSGVPDEPGFGLAGWESSAASVPLCRRSCFWL